MVFGHSATVVLVRHQQRNSLGQDLKDLDDLDDLELVQAAPDRSALWHSQSRTRHEKSLT